MKLHHLIMGSLTSALVLTYAAPLYAVEHQLGNLPVTSQADIAPEDTFRITSSQGSITWGYWSSSLIEIEAPGAFSEASPGSALFFSTGTQGPGGVRFILSGNNSYTGRTLVGTQGGGGPVIVRASSSTALGTGIADVDIAGGGGGSNTKQTNALELSGGITISQKNLLLQGAGYGGKGSLNSVDGNNVWAGTVSIRSFTDPVLKPTIGVETDSLDIQGEISGNSVSGLTKVGSGTLILSAANSFQNGLIISAGAVLATHAKALAEGSLEIGSLGRLEVGAGTLLELSDIDLKENARLAFNLTSDLAATGLQVNGAQSGGGTYLVDINSEEPLALGRYELMTIGGSTEAAGFTIGNLPQGYAGELQWSGGVLSLNVTAIPEPGTAMLLIGAGVLGVASRLTRNGARR